MGNWIPLHSPPEKLIQVLRFSNSIYPNSNQLLASSRFVESFSCCLTRLCRSTSACCTYAALPSDKNPSQSQFICHDGMRKFFFSPMMLFRPLNLITYLISLFHSNQVNGTCFHMIYSASHLGFLSERLFIFCSL